MNTPRGQRGAMAITMALLLIGLISILGLVTVAQYYWAKRDAQKVADMAALSAAQHFNPDCGPASVQAANTNAKANWDSGGQRSITTTCGNWNPASNPPDTYFVAGTTSTAPANAIKVIAHVTPTTIIPAAIAGEAFQINATAIAANSPPVAAFSVGSQLLQLHEDGLLPSLLKVVGLDVAGSGLVGYQGLANVHITPAGLLDQLGIDTTAIIDVGTLNSVLAAHDVNVGELIHAVATIASQNQLANATIEALDSLAVHAEQQSLGPVQLGTASPTGTPRGLFAYINTATVQSALDAKVNALDILNTSLQVANSHHLIDLTQGGMPGLELLGGVKLWTTVIEPPSIAIGGPGATAYTAQVRIGLRITTDAIPVLGPVLGLLGTSIDIPLVIDVVNGKGVLQGKGPDNKQLCDHDDLGPYATLATTSRLLNVCISDFDPQHLGSTSEPCQEDLKNVALVTLLDTPLISGSTHIWGFTGDKNLDLHVGETKSETVNLDLGGTVNNIAKGVLQLLAGQTIDNASDTHHDNGTMNTDAMATHLWNGQSIDYNDTHIDCQDLGNSDSDGTERLKCRKAIFQKLQDNAALNPTMTGLLPGLGNLLGGLVDSLDNLLDGLLKGVFGNGCGPALFGHGTTQACINDISDALADSQSTNNGTTTSNALLALLGPVLNVLQPVLDLVGTQILEPLVKAILGNDIGRTDVHLMSLQCQGAHLVY